QGAEPPAGADAFQRPLRSRFQARLRPGVMKHEVVPKDKPKSTRIDDPKMVQIDRREEFPQCNLMQYSREAGQEFIVACHTESKRLAVGKCQRHAGIFVISTSCVSSTCATSWSKEGAAARRCPSRRATHCPA